MRGGAHTAKERKEALVKAEGKLTTKGRPKGEPAMVSLSVAAIKIMPELFQPREFTHGFFEVDRMHVTKLKRAIEINGELDPPLVIKLRTKWVCVDGHHRLAAYTAVKWAAPITCEWFGGTAREAMDESMARNKKDRLNVPQQDKLEEAWKRTVIGGWSKAQTVRLCGAGEGSVALMRRIVLLARRKNDTAATEFRRRLTRGIDEVSWSLARMAFNGLEPREFDAEIAAGKLAKRIGARLTNVLSRNPEVTARALMIYDPDLPAQLIAAWGAPPSRASTISNEDD